MIKTILINGATSGLGKQLSIFFDRKDYKLICLGKDKKKMFSLKKRLKKTHIFINNDFTKEKNLKSLKKDLNKYQNIDAVIHSMGGGLGLKKDLLPKEDFLKLFSVNLLVQSEINNLLISKAIKKKKKLKIVHLSTTASLESIASIGYSTAKSALNTYSKILSKKFLKNKIDVKNLILGAFETEDNSFARLKKKNLKAYNDFKKKRLPLNRYAISDEIIPVIEFILSNKSNILSNELIIDNRELNTFRN